MKVELKIRNFNIQRIVFNSTSADGHLHYTKETGKWSGFCQIYYNYRFFNQDDGYKDELFFYEIDKNGYAIYNKLSNNEALYKELLTDELVQQSFDDLVHFINELNQLKEKETIKIEKVIDDFEYEDEKKVTMDDLSLEIAFSFNASREGNTLSLTAIPSFKSKKVHFYTEEKEIMEFLGEKTIRNIWKETIKNEKNRLLMINYTLD